MLEGATRYMQAILELLQHVKTTQQQPMADAIKILEQTVRADGRNLLFGS